MTKNHKQSVLVDCSSWTKLMNGVKRVGLYTLERYFEEVELTAIVSHQSVGVEINKISKGNIKVIVSPIKSKIFIHYIFIPWVVIVARPSVYWSQNHRIPFLFWKKTKTVLVVHDLTSIFFPQTLSLTTLISERLHFKRSVQAADRILVFSNATREDVAKHFNVCRGNIFRITPKYLAQKCNTAHHGVSQRRQPKAPFLYIGTFEPRKNLTQLIVAHQSLPLKLRSKHPLVLMGRFGWKTKEMRGLLKNDCNQTLVVTENPTDEDIRSALQKCYALVMPSLYEGFGLPVLEAMSMNRIILCSDIPIFKEILKNNAVFFSPFSSKNIANALCQSLNTRKLTAEVINPKQAFDKLMNEVDDSNQLFKCW